MYCTFLTDIQGFVNLIAESKILTIIELLGNLCVILITVYTFSLGFFSSRVTLVSLLHSHGNRGDSLSITLKNRTMKTFFIKSVELIIDNKYSVQIKSSDSEPTVLESLGAVVIKMEKYSGLADGFKIPLLRENRMYARLELEERYLNARQPIHLRKRHNKQFQPITVFRSTYCDMLIQDGDIYALHYFSKPAEEDEHIIIIHKSGIMSDSMPQYCKASNTLEAFNAIPKEIACSYDRTKELFQEICEPFGTKFQLIKLNAVLRYECDESE